ncbi:MAG: GtrA family protein [Treponema sp.]|jgi:putative flippase GtrA|nr:GtrA family protein [Treponema sp.]
MIFDKVLLKFLLVGLINTLVGAGLMFILYNVAGLNYWASSAANYIAGGVLSFFLNKYWTFNVRKWSVLMVSAFIVNIAISYFLAYKIARTAIHSLLAEHPEKMRDNAALLAGMCLYTGLNYIGQRFIVFSKTNKGGK